MAGESRRAPGAAEGQADENRVVRGQTPLPDALRDVVERGSTSVQECRVPGPTPLPRDVDRVVFFARRCRTLTSSARLARRRVAERRTRPRSWSTSRPTCSGPSRASRRPSVPLARRRGPSEDGVHDRRVGDEPSARERSPYLLQHADNPVDWYPWGDEAFARARSEDKPIFLSIGYSTCHWCHVMEHESFEDEAIAGAPEPRLRLDQGRSRGAARRRPRLHGVRAGDDRVRRLADDASSSRRT